MIKRFALTRGDFTLASGKKSTFYLDVKKAYTRPDVMEAIVDGMKGALAGKDVDRVGGMALGAVPLAAALSLGINVPFVMIRKEGKGYGTGNMIEGEVQSGDRVILVEDVTTTGGSVMKAVMALREAGCDIDTVITVVDRQEGAKELLEEAGINLVALVSSIELGLKEV